MQRKKFNGKKTKKIASSLLTLSIVAMMGFSSISTGFALDNVTNVEPTTVEDTTSTNEDVNPTSEEETLVSQKETEGTISQPVIEEPTEDTSSEPSSQDPIEEFGTLQIQKVPKNLDYVSEFHNAKGIFLIYTDKDDMESFIPNVYLETGIDGYSNIIELPIGTYYVRESVVAPGYLPATEMHEVVIEKDKASLEIIEADTFAIPEPIMTFAGVNGKSYTGKIDRDYGMMSPCQGENPGRHLMGSTPVYCMQPGVYFGEGETYIASKTRPYFLTASTVKKLELINYYCNKYKKYDSRLAYSMAQSMMWRTISDETLDDAVNDYGSSNAHFYTTLDGTRVDSTPQWKEVKSNIAKHYTKPSFNTKTYAVDLNTPYKLQDTNGVLSKYSFGKVNGVTISKSGNNVTFTVTDPSLVNKTIKIPYNFYADSKDGDTLFYRYQYAIDEETKSYYDTMWQMCAEFYVSDAQSGYVNLKVGGTGELEIQKTSSKPEMTNGNNAYSLQGAEYTVYSNQACTNAVGKLTTTATGLSNKLELSAGTYWVKETKAPKGYALDTKIHEVSVVSGQKNTFNVSDKPQNDPVGVLLEKRDASTGQSKPVTNGSLANAQFTFKFYAGEYADGVDPAKQGIQPTRTWIFRTDSDGYTDLSESYKISGDAFFKDGNGVPTLPIGTITIQETKAPTGYHLNPEIFVRKITSSGSAENIYTYNAPIVPENAIRFHIVKYEKGTSNAVSGVEFIHTFPNGTTETVKTNAQGKIELTGLASGQHKIQEKSTIPGLVVNPNAFSFTVNKDGSITNNTSDLGNKMFGFTTDHLGNGVLTVYNDFADFNIDINKINNKSLKLSGAEFTLFSDSNCTNVVAKLTTDANGTLTFKGLDVDKVYYLQETKAPAGYRIPVDANWQCVTHTIQIKEVSAVKGTFTFIVDGQTYTVNSTSGTIHVEGTPANRTIDMTFTNEILTQLPETGSTTGLIALVVVVLVVAMCGVAMVNQRKKKLNHGNKK